MQMYFGHTHNKWSLPQIGSYLGYSPIQILVHPTALYSGNGQLTGLTLCVYLPYMAPS